MTRHLSCTCFVLALGSLGCGPPPQPYRQVLEQWFPSQEEKVQLERFTREYVLKRGLLDPKELAYITVDTCVSGWVHHGKRMIGISISDRRLLPDNIDELADGILRREAARIMLVLVNSTDRQVVQVTLHESRRRDAHRAAPGDAKRIRDHSPGLKADNPWIPKYRELRKEVDELRKRTWKQEAALKKAREEYRELRSEKLSLEVKVRELQKESAALKNELGRPRLLAYLVRLFRNATMFTSQANVAEKIVKLGDKNAIKQLEPYLNDDDRHVRCNAALVLAGLGDRRGLDAIAEVIGDRSERPEAQGIPGGNWTVGRQIKADRYYAVHVLGMLKSARAIPILVPLLKDPEVGYKAAWALGETGSSEAVEPLIGALGHRSPNVRVSAIKSLQKLSARSALPRLRELLDDSARSNLGGQPSVGDAAREAIARLEAQPGEPTE